jgi:hypothetical protein
MQLLHTKTKEGLKVYEDRGNVYNENNLFRPMHITEMVQLLSHNRIYPKIKFDRQIELIYDNKNSYVIGKTLHRVFCNLVIKIFSQTNE